MWKKLIENNIKWNNFFVESDQFGIHKDCTFEISPRDFLAYAKEDLKKTSDIVHNSINVTTNAKRAIDCQIDWLITILGYDFRNFDKCKVIQDFIDKRSNSSSQINGENRKIEFINLLGLSPKMLISKYRFIRNKLEHEYKEISEEEAVEILELAEFFINASDYKIRYDFPSAFCINNIDKETSTYDMYFLFNEIPSSTIEIISVVDEDRYEIKIKNNEDLYMQMLELVINKNFNKMPKLLGYDIPEECINVQFDYI